MLKIALLQFLNKFCFFYIKNIKCIIFNIKKFFLYFIYCSPFKKQYPEMKLYRNVILPDKIISNLKQNIRQNKQAKNLIMFNEILSIMNKSLEFVENAFFKIIVKKES